MRNHPYEKIKKHRFYARYYGMRWRRPPIKKGKKTEGYCNHTKGFVYIYPNKNRQEFLDTLIHESMHIFAPEFSEECVELIATDLGLLLWKAGFRYLPDLEQKIGEKL